MTELGTRPLRDLCVFKHGGTPSKSNPSFWAGDIPWVSPKDMKQAVIDSATDYISAEAVAGSATSIVPSGSILAVVRSGILAHSFPIAQVAKPLAFNQDIKAVIPVSEDVDPHYLYWFLRSQSRNVVTRGVKKGATVHSVQSGFIENLQVPMRPREDQRRIVDLLARAEGIVRLRREAQQKAAELIPAIFIDTFGEPATNPKGWPVVPLGEVIKRGPSNGLYKHRSAYGAGTPILRIDGFYDGVITGLSQLKRVQLEDEDELRRFALVEGDIVVNRVNSPEYLGKSAIVPRLAEPTVFESNMMLFGVDGSRVLPEFVIALLQQPASRRHLLANAKHAINQSSINQQDVKSVPVPLPPVALQQAFAQRIAAVASIRGQQAEATSTAQASFDALLAGAFRGA
jgi:type I restriction enzyme S subunit